MHPPFLPVKYDVIFRMFFADERNEQELIGLLKSLTNLPEEDYDDIEILDPHMLPEYAGDKYAVIDVKLRTKSRKIVHIEMQLQVPPSMRERIVYYGARLITEQIGSGVEYNVIKKVISIIITDETLIPDSSGYVHRFMFYDPGADVLFTDIMEIITVELNKLPKTTDGTTLYDWARFIDARTEEELDMAADSNPDVKKAVVKFRELSADERVRDRIERREKGRRDFADFMMGAEAKGREKGLAEGRAEGREDVARNALKMNIDIETVAALTGLSRSDIEALREAD
jgi:predicted transposase/invertase (TIGR01784 family)